MASRWMQSKLAIMARQRKNLPPSSLNRGGHTVEGSNRATSLVAPLVKKYTGVVTVAPKGAMVQPVGKTQRMFDTRTYGNGARIERRASEYYGLWSCEGDRLIKAAGSR